MEDFSAYLKKRIEFVNEGLDKLLPPVDQRPAVLHQAMRYSVFAGGKRLRPILFLGSIEALGKEISSFLSFACALELIHTYSLIHDDLPAMDDDDLRRGLPTCHIKFGEAQAILAGDALLTYAFNLMIKTQKNGIEAERLLLAIDEVAYSAGLKGMIVGQVVDIESENRDINLDELQYIHLNKTGALFRAALRSGGILGGATEFQLKKLTEFAEQFGLAFQITDDILDVIGDEAKLGKPTGSDSRKSKATYPTLLGLEQSKKLAREAVEKAVQSLDCFDSKADPLREIAYLLVNRES